MPELKLRPPKNQLRGRFYRAAIEKTMKISTVILLALAAALAGAVYYYEFKRPPTPEKAADESQPAFKMPAEDITAIAIDRGGSKILLEKHGNDWVISQPVETQADRSVIEGIATNLAGARISRTLPAAPDRMQAFGLEQPAVQIDFKGKDGKQHTLALGEKDFSGQSVYGIVDGAKDVSLLPGSLLTIADKQLDDLRDRSVLDVESSDLNGFDLKNKAGELAAKKGAADWQFEKPRAAAADTGAVDSLLAQVTSAKMTQVVSETASGLGKYGLNHPEIVFRGHDVKGQNHTLLVGKKIDDDYYARDAARPMIFRVKSGLYKKLGETFSDLRDKAIAHLDRDKMKRVEIRNQNQTFIAEQGAGNKWTVVEPADRKGKEVESWKFLDPIDTARAQEILDSPPGDIVARLARPPVEVTITGPSGKTIKISVSAAAGGSAYARSSAGPAIYKVDKKLLDDLNFKVADLF